MIDREAERPSGGTEAAEAREQRCVASVGLSAGLSAATAIMVAVVTWIVWVLLAG
jgi:hypothetical protein